MKESAFREQKKPAPGRGWHNNNNKMLTERVCLYVFARKDTQPQANFLADGQKPPYSPKFLYRFLSEGRRVEAWEMVKGTSRDPISNPTGKMVDWRNYHRHLREALLASNEKKYQQLKSYRLPAVVWSGAPDRRKATVNWDHSGIINFDVDPVKGEVDLPADARQQLEHIPFLQAHGRSPRGIVPGRGEGWANFVVEFPDPRAITPSERSLFDRWLPRSGQPTTFHLHKLYAHVIKLYLKHEEDYPWATHADAKRLRYLIYDPELYVNPSPTPLTWATLKGMYSQLEPLDRKVSRKRKEDRKVNLDTSDLAAVLKAEAIEHYESKFDARFVAFEPGCRHDFVLSFFISAHVLGIPAEVAQSIFEQDYHDDTEEVEKMVADAIEWVEEFYTRYEFGTFSSRLRDVGKRTIHLAKGQYLSQVINPGDLDNTLLIAPTGSGKTRACMENIEGPVIITTPLSALVRQIATRPGSQFTTIKPFVDDSGTERTGIDWKNPPEKIVCTIASMEVLIEELKRGNRIKKYHLVVDECHYFAMAASPNYMLSDLRNLWEHRKMFRAQTLMTGTPIYLHDTVDLKRLEVTMDKKKRKTFQRLYVRRARQGRTTDTLAHYLRQIMEEQPEVPVVVWQNDKKRLRPILQGLFAGDDRVLFVDSHTKTKSPELWSHLCEQPGFPEGCQVLVSTSTIQEGLDFEAYQGKAIVIFTGYPSVEEIQQLSERFRKAEKIEVKLFATAPAEDDEKMAHQEPDSELLCALESSLAADLHRIRRQRGLPISAYRALSLMGSRGYLYAREGRGSGLDTLRLNHKAYKATKRARWSNPTLFDEAIQEYDMEVLTTEYIDPVARTEEAQEAIDLAMDLIEDEAQAAFDRTADTIFSIRTNIVSAARAYQRTQNYMLAMGEEDAAFTIEDYMAYIARDKEVYHTLLPQDQRLSKAHQQAVSSRLYAEWLIQQPGCPDEIREAVLAIMEIKPGVYTETQVKTMAARAVRILEDIGASFPPFSIQRSRTLLRPFLRTKKIRGREEYEIIPFVLPARIRYFCTK